MIQKTELAWDPYMRYLEEAINKSKFNKRAESKPMATPKGAGESHLTSRVNHERLAANIMRYISGELGLNYDYAYIAMLAHDAGHPFSAHEGEEVFSLIGRSMNCGYFHHNAKGIEVIESEDICGKAIDMIPGIENNPELRKKLEEEFYYFLDIIISHDGEATKSDLRKEMTPYPSMKEAVLTKLRKANSHNDYKFIAQTEEGKLAKIADVMAYMPTDIQDGFRLGIIDHFDDDYLELFGQLFSETDSLDREGYIKYAKDMLKDIKSQRMREVKSDMREPENQAILAFANDIIDEAIKQGLNIDALSQEERDALNQLVDTRIDELAHNRTFSNETEEQMFRSDMSKLREFVSKMTSVSTDVVAGITNKMEQFFINDFVTNSQAVGRAEFSKRVEDIFYKIKALDYDKIVKFTKWDYQREGQPEAVQELAEITAESLVKSGVIRDKFYDRTIRRYVTDSKALSYMVTPRRDEEEYDKYKERTGISIRNKTSLHGKFTESNPKKLHKYSLFKNAYQYARKEGRSFAIKYMNVFEAIPYTVRHNVRCALSNKIEQKDFLKEYQQENNQRLRNRMIAEYGSIEEAEKKQEEFIAKLIEEERGKMEEKMAAQIAIDYLSGMTDRSFNDLAIRTGYMTYEQVFEAKRDMKASQSVEDHLAALKRDEAQSGKTVDER